MTSPKSNPPTATAIPAASSDDPGIPRNDTVLKSGRTMSVSPANVLDSKPRKTHVAATRRNKARFIYDFSDFGSNQSRSASPRKLKDKTVNTSAKDGNTTM